MAAIDTYGKLLNAEGAIDFADLMLTAVRDMHSKSMPPLSVRWLLVDEAQDMDEIQIESLLSKTAYDVGSSEGVGYG